jgi:predicted GNAT family N-acyltransferase
VTRVRRVATEADLADALSVRHAVFVAEQGVPADRERDGFDALGAALHLVARDGDRAVGAARLRADDEKGEPGTGGLTGATRAKLERVAVLPDRRGEGVGRALTERAAAVARDHGVERVVLHAQRRVEDFYAALGYRRVGDEFEEAGIPHVRMVRDL